MVESHYWILGEEYHLVTAAEPDFETALRRQVFLLEGHDKDSNELIIDHPDKKKEMDIFALRWSMYKDTVNNREMINNIVVELKNPRILLGEEELSQVLKYMRVIRQTPQFNSPQYTWQFYLIGNRFDTTRYIEDALENKASEGERALVHSNLDNTFKVYVKTWADIFAEFELRHNYLLEQLKLERESLAAAGRTQMPSLTRRRIILLASFRISKYRIEGWTDRGGNGRHRREQVNALIIRIIHLIPSPTTTLPAREISLREQIVAYRVPESATLNPNAP